MDSSTLALITLTLNVSLRLRMTPNTIFPLETLDPLSVVSGDNIHSTVTSVRNDIDTSSLKESL